MMFDIAVILFIYVLSIFVLRYTVNTYCNKVLLTGSKEHLIPLYVSVLTISIAIANTFIFGVDFFNNSLVAFALVTVIHLVLVGFGVWYYVKKKYPQITASGGE